MIIVIAIVCLIVGGVLVLNAMMTAGGAEKMFPRFPAPSTRRVGVSAVFGVACAIAGILLLLHARVETLR